ncbi:MAG: S-adenosylmethionine:tRNA ribosyltransferase-isomerase, partial [Methyloceanibacter sp.]
MRTDLFDFHLPEELIALRPVVPRDAARLLLVEPHAIQDIADRMVRDLPALLLPGDALVFNDTKVIPAELDGVRRRDEVAAKVAVTLIERLGPDRWQAFARPAKRLNAGDRIAFGESEETCLACSLAATVASRGKDGEATLVFDLT